MKEGVLGSIVDRAHRKVKPLADTFFLEADKNKDAMVRVSTQWHNCLLSCSQWQHDDPPGRGLQVSKAEFEAWFVEKNGDSPSAKDWLEFAEYADSSGTVSEHEFAAHMQSKKKNNGIILKTSAVSKVIIYPNNTSSTRLESKFPSSTIKKDMKTLVVLIHADDPSVQPTPTIFAEMVSNIGGLSLPMLKLDLGLEVFQFTKVGKTLAVHTLVNISALFLNPATAARATWQDVVKSPRLFVTFKKSPTEKSLRINPCDKTPVVLNISDSLLYSCTQARNAMKRQVDSKLPTSRIINCTNVPLRFRLAAEGTSEELLPGEQASLQGIDDVTHDHSEDCVLHVSPKGWDTKPLRLYNIGDIAIDFASEANPESHRPFFFSVRLLEGTIVITCNGGTLIENRTSRALCLEIAEGKPGATRQQVGQNQSLHVPQGERLRFSIPEEDGASEPVQIGTSTKAVAIPMQSGGVCELAVQMQTGCNGITLVTVTSAMSFQNLLPHHASFVVTYKSQVANIEVAAGEVVELFDFSIPEDDQFDLKVIMDPSSGWGAASSTVTHDAAGGVVQVSDGLGTSLYLTVKSPTPRSVSVFCTHWVKNQTGLALMLSSSKFQIWPSVLSDSHRNSRVHCVELGGNAEHPSKKLHIAVVGSEPGAVNINKKYSSSRLQLWSKVHRQLYDLEVTVEAAPPPFQQTKVISVRPQVALVNKLAIGSDVAFRGQRSDTRAASPWVHVAAGGCAVPYHPRTAEAPSTTEIALFEHTAGEYRCVVSTHITVDVQNPDFVAHVGTLSKLKGGKGHDDDTIDKGTRLLVSRFGRGSVCGFHRNLVGANEHRIQFDGCGDCAPGKHCGNCRRLVMLKETNWHFITEIEAVLPSDDCIRCVARLFFTHVPKRQSLTVTR